MTDTETQNGRAEEAEQPQEGADPTLVRNLNDPGDATSRNYRYQHAYGVTIMAAAKRGQRPYVAIWCEQHEDFLAERHDGMFDGFQIKTARPENGPWKLTDAEFTKSVGRFIDLVAEFDDRIGDLFFVSNKEFDQVTPISQDTRRRGRCPGLFLDHAKGCGTRADIGPPFDNAFDELQASCGCSPEQLLAVLHRMDLISGPSRGEFDAALAHEHLSQLDDCRDLTAEQLDEFRDNLVARVHRASSLQVTDPIRHLRALVRPQDGDPALAAKRVVVAEVIVYRAEAPPAPGFRYPGRPTLELGAGVKSGVLEQKLVQGGLEDQVGYMNDRALAAEYNLLEDVARRPESFPELLRQIEQKVHGELCEAHLRARLLPAPYGPAMLIDAQERLRRLATDDPTAVGGHAYDCLVGVAGLLTSDCRVWWSPRFPVNDAANP